MASTFSPEFIWQDRDIRFDSKPNVLVCRSNEAEIDSINSVEDTKGNNGERGSLVITNLRILWICHANTKINLSIGLNSIISISIRKAKSKLRGQTQALCVLAKQASRFEFVFTSLVKNSPRMFTTVQAVLRAYQTSKLYRDLKLRGSIIRDNDLILLPLEQVYSKIGGAWNLSSDQGNLGTMFITNVRIVWHANLAINFNVSLPYQQIKTIRVRESKFGQALVLETFARAGGYILGFRMDPPDRLDSVFREINSMLLLFSSNPIFGVEYTVETDGANAGGTSGVTEGAAEDSAGLHAGKQRIEEDVEILDEDGEDAHAVAAYYLDGDNGALAGDEGVTVANVEFDEQLGLAIEPLKGDMTIEQLWRVL